MVFPVTRPTIRSFQQEMCYINLSLRRWPGGHWGGPQTIFPLHPLLLRAVPTMPTYLGSSSLSVQPGLAATPQVFGWLFPIGLRWDDMREHCVSFCSGKVGPSTTRPLRSYLSLVYTVTSIGLCVRGLLTYASAAHANANMTEVRISAEK